VFEPVQVSQALKNCVSETGSHKNINPVPMFGSEGGSESNKIKLIGSETK
jgi:hypothetical protein